MLSHISGVGLNMWVGDAGTHTVTGCESSLSGGHRMTGLQGEGGLRT